MEAYANFHEPEDQYCNDVNLLFKAVLIVNSPKLPTQMSINYKMDILWLHFYMEYFTAVRMNALHQ